MTQPRASWNPETPSGGKACGPILQSEGTMNYYRQQFKKLLTAHDLDHVLVYANTYNGRFMKAIAGTCPLQQNYIIISKHADYLTETRYFLLDIKRRTAMKLLATEGEDYGFIEVMKKVGSGKNVGIVGDFKYQDFASLQPARIVDLTEEAHKIILHKTDEYISVTQKHARVTAEILSKIEFQPGDTGATHAQTIFRTAVQKNYDLSFSTCITSGEDLFETTTVVAGKKKIRRKDMVCIDMGLKQGIYTTDITRMFFVNQPEAQQIYKSIVAIHNDIIAHFVSPEKTFREVISCYQERFHGNKDVKDVPEDDFGHGIGFALHEMPILEKTTRAIGKNIIFTLEPTFVTKFGKMRIEDMIGVFSNGKVVNLTGKKEC